MRGKSDASEPQCTTKAGIKRLTLMCNIKNTVKVAKTQAWSSPENGTPNSVQKSQQPQPHIPLETCLKNWSNKMKIPSDLQNALPENCSKTVDKKEIHSFTLHVDNSWLNKEKGYTLCFFFNSQSHFDIVQAYARLDSFLAVHSQRQKFTQRFKI